MEHKKSSYFVLFSIMWCFITVKFWAFTQLLLSTEILKQNLLAMRLFVVKKLNIKNKAEITYSFKLS